MPIRKRPETDENRRTALITEFVKRAYERLPVETPQLTTDRVGLANFMMLVVTICEQPPNVRTTP